jgi:sialate O-acetylesterase
MQRQVQDSDEADEAVADIQNVNIRCFDGSRWQVVTPANVKQISAVGAYFAMEMARRQKEPVGIFVAARGGTGIEAWVPVEAFPDTADGNRFKPLVNDPEVLKAAAEDAADFKPWGQHRLFKWNLGRAVPSSLFETLVRPFGDLPVCGAVWYQGESNASTVERAQEYRLWLQGLIGAYRNLWRNPDMPFVIIQLPDYDPGSDSGRAGWATLQEVQADVAKNTTNAAIVDIKDLGDLKDIHPRRKKEVGIRAADAAWKLLGK